MVTKQQGLSPNATTVNNVLHILYKIEREMSIVYGKKYKKYRRFLLFFTRVTTNIVGHGRFLPASAPPPGIFPVIGTVAWRSSYQRKGASRHRGAHAPGTTPVRVAQDTACVGDRCHSIARVAYNAPAKESPDGKNIKKVKKGVDKADVRVYNIYLLADANLYFTAAVSFC